MLLVLTPPIASSLMSSKGWSLVVMNMSILMISLTLYLVGLNEMSLAQNGMGHSIPKIEILLIGPRNGIAHYFIHSNPSINPTISSFLKVRVKPIPFIHAFRLSHASLYLPLSLSRISLSLPRISISHLSLPRISLFLFCLSPTLHSLFISFRLKILWIHNSSPLKTKFKPQSHILELRLLYPNRF